MIDTIIQICEDSTKREVMDSCEHRRTNGFPDRRTTSIKVRRIIRSLILLGQQLMVGGDNSQDIGMVGDS